MKKILLSLLIVVSLQTCALAQSEPNEGFTAWGLFGDQFEELRVGYEGLLNDFEVAIGGVHRDAVDPFAEEWSLRGYAIAHALDAEMLASVLGGERKLPDGELYAGLFAEYTFDREKEWSGGYVIGGRVHWPKDWMAVVEYQATMFNSTDNDYKVVGGLAKAFKPPTHQ